MKRPPKAAKAVLVGTISLDEDNKRLVKAYAEGLHSKPPQDFLDLDDALRSEKPA